MQQADRLRTRDREKGNGPMDGSQIDGVSSRNQRSLASQELLQQANEEILVMGLAADRLPAPEPSAIAR